MIALNCFNEKDTILNELKAWQKMLLNCQEDVSLFIYDGGSTDGTSELLIDLPSTNFTFIPSKTRINFRNTLIQMMRDCNCDFLFYSDSGNKFYPEDFLKFLAVSDVCDIISGRRVDRNDQKYRRMFTKVYNFVIRKYFKIPHTFDSDCGFKLYNREVINFILNQNLLFTNLVTSEIVIRTIRANFVYKELNVKYKKRDGTSRGLPPKKIFFVVFESLNNLRKLKTLLDRKI